MEKVQEKIETTQNQPLESGLEPESTVALSAAKRPLLVPIVRELPADLETPVSVYLKLAGATPSFLLESVTGGEQVARYSFIGINPSRAYKIWPGQLVEHLNGFATPRRVVETADPFQALRQELTQFQFSHDLDLPRFAGGLVGYLSYEAVRYFESGMALPAHAELPDAIFLMADTLVAFDHAFGRLLLIANTDIAEDEAAARAEAEQRLDGLVARLQQPLTVPPAPVSLETVPPLTSNVSRERFMEMVAVAKEHIAAGDIFQVVLSQRLSRETSARPFDIYRALRRLNPSPYMFYFDFAGLTGETPLRLIGASPEMHVRLEDGVGALRPIAGTRPRGRNTGADQRFEAELLADPKERAEHVMLVDLARNDLGRVSAYGSVTVPEKMRVERYSHVMHLVSQVEGRVRPDIDAFDLMAATFPAGTVSGAPKIRAMEIIQALEAEARGPYGGAVGYFSFDGSSDTCITIRTLLMQGQTISVQAGAGIVADSDPAREFEETLNKAQALAVAVTRAEGGTS